MLAWGFIVLVGTQVILGGVSGLVFFLTASVDGKENSNMATSIGIIVSVVSYFSLCVTLILGYLGKLPGTRVDQQQDK